MIFMLLFYSDEKAIAAMTPAEQNSLVEAHVAYNHDFLQKRCEVLATRALQPTVTAVTVAPDGRRAGPAAALDRPLTGFYLIDCADADEAAELAAAYPMPAGLGAIEVRPVMQEWDYAPSVDTAASPDAVWHCFRDVDSWPAWKYDVVKVELDRGFEPGASGRLFTTGQPAMPYRLVSVEPESGYTSETEVAPGIGLRIEHRITARDGGSRITIRAKVPRAALDVHGHEFSPRLNDSIRRTLAALAARAETT